MSEGFMVKGRAKLPQEIEAVKNQIARDAQVRLVDIKAFDAATSNAVDHGEEEIFAQHIDFRKKYLK